MPPVVLDEVDITLLAGFQKIGLQRLLRIINQGRNLIVPYAISDERAIDENAVPKRAEEFFKEVKVKELDAALKAAHTSTNKCDESPAETAAFPFDRLPQELRYLVLRARLVDDLYELPISARGLPDRRCFKRFLQSAWNLASTFDLDITKDVYHIVIKTTTIYQDSLLKASTNGQLKSLSSSLSTPRKLLLALCALNSMKMTEQTSEEFVYAIKLVAAIRDILNTMQKISMVKLEAAKAKLDLMMAELRNLVAGKALDSAGVN